jgi:hypothetical protein
VSQKSSSSIPTLIGSVILFFIVLKIATMLACLFAIVIFIQNLQKR